MKSQKISISELRKVSGIGDKTIEKIKEHLLQSQSDKGYSFLKMTIWPDYSSFIPKEVLYWEKDGRNAFVRFARNNSTGELFFNGKEKLMPCIEMIDFYKFFQTDVIDICMDNNKREVDLNRETYKIKDVLSY